MFAFYALCCGLKEKGQIAKDINSKKGNNILVCQKLGSIGPVHQKIMLPSP